MRISEKRMLKLTNELKKIHIKYKTNIQLSSLTTIRVGGLASIILEPENSSQLYEAVYTAEKFGFQFKVIGNGSNLIISDTNIDFLPIINKKGQWEVVDTSPVPYNIKRKFPQNDSNSDKIFENGKDVIVQADSGIRLTQFATELYQKRIFGLEHFAGIHSTIGGAVYKNIHGMNKLFSDIIESVTILDNSKIRIISREKLNFDYDYSFLQDTNQILLSANLRLKQGDITELKKLRAKWIQQKTPQPQKSAGCIFQNLTKEQQDNLDLPTQSIGYFIDQKLNLKGKIIGGAKISENHAEFIENIGDATSNDIHSLIKFIQNESEQKYKIKLALKVELAGKFK